MTLQIMAATANRVLADAVTTALYTEPAPLAAEWFPDVSFGGPDPRRGRLPPPLLSQPDKEGKKAHT